MRTYPPESTASKGSAAEPRTRERKLRPSAATGELAAWLKDRIDKIGAWWSEEIDFRGPDRSGAFGRVQDRFVRQFAGMLPLLLGTARSEVRPFWIRASELYGAVAASRGLAAGEVIEELHLLKELVIRELYRHPPHGGRRPLALSEVLRLNRALDWAVTYASVGHTDALFYQLLEQDGERAAPHGQSLADEAEAQLDALIGELDEALLHFRPDAGSGAEAGGDGED